MTKHISFPSIDQYRGVIRHVQENCKHHQVVLPTITFTGTVKLHGTNHAVCMSPSGEIYTQSRERITSLESDNAGSHVWTMQNIEYFDKLFENIKEDHFVGAEDTIQVYGEWCGGNIQKGVGLNHVPKMFVIFAIRISKDSDSQVFLTDSEVDWVLPVVGTSTLFSQDFGTWTLDIDFNKPEQVQEQLQNITLAIEQDCPAARSLLGEDFPGPLVGEGVVWTGVFKGNTLRFKVKGEKHSSSKVKTLAMVDVEKVESIREFVATVITESRLNQGLEHVPARDPVHTGAFLKWVMSDVYKEESDTMIENGFTSKEVSGPMATAIRQWFLRI